ncbi:MAG TPA: cupredoxin domain-containing protein [Candidatus Nanoarchaeia archaeon]|nr:cupredoxin domain-containing protein [Candidatus Nanoarchaeia archaeon]
MKIKKSNLLYLVGILLIILLAGSFVISKSENLSNVSGTVYNGDVQIVKLSVQNGNYVLEPSEFKEGVLVRIEADLSNMPGCSRSVVIPSFKVSKTFSSNNNIIEFIPDKAGTFNIVCSMNMYSGKFTVLEKNGTKSDYVEQKINSGSSCGAGGGCGCGG